MRDDPIRSALRAAAEAALKADETLREVERYTRAAEQTGLARAAMARISAPAEVVAMPKKEKR